MKKSWALLALTVLMLLPLALACGGSNELILATTTSTQDTGLLDVLVPAFEKQYDYHVKVIAVGSGQALTMGQQGEADVILSHSPKAEQDFVAAGWGIERQVVMHNDFVIIGPKSDPAGISGGKKAADAFAAIARSGSLFLSRGDQSGTNTKELSLWTTAGVDPKGKSWYQETGQGMGATLTVANEKDAYTLSDRGTWLAQQANLSALGLLVQGDANLYNVYHVIVVNPAKHSNVNVQGARDFAKFILSSDTQDMIRKFGVDKYGQALFVPDALVDSSTGATPQP